MISVLYPYLITRDVIYLNLVIHNALLVTREYQKTLRCGRS